MPARPPALAVPGAPAAAADAVSPANYLVRVEWKESKADPKFLEVLTTDGNFDIDTIQKESVKINNADVPITLKCNGTLTPLDDKRGRFKLFIGRTVPYVTSSFAGGGSSYQQLSVGLQSTFIVEFGKSQVIQSDENGKISVLVKRIAE